MKMSTKARYGLYACIKLAEKYGDNYHSIIDVANEINVSDGYLEQIIAKLKKADKEFKDWVPKGEITIKDIKRKIIIAFCINHI